MGKKRDDFAWLVIALEDLNANRREWSSYSRRQPNEVDYESWRKEKNRGRISIIVYVALFAISLIIPLLLH